MHRSAMKKPLFLTVTAILLIAAGVYAQQTPGYQVTNTFHILSGGGYDYTTVDSASNRLYLSHGTQVNVKMCIRDSNYDDKSDRKSVV